MNPVPIRQIVKSGFVNIAEILKSCRFNLVQFFVNFGKFSKCVCHVTLEQLGYLDQLILAISKKTELGRLIQTRLFHHYFHVTDNILDSEFKFFSDKIL